MKKIYYKLVVSLLIAFLYTDVMKADTPAPPPPGGGGGGTNPEAPSSPVDMYVYLLFGFAIAYFVYLTYKNYKTLNGIKY